MLFWCKALSVIDTINKSHSKNKAISVSTFVVPTLNIPTLKIFSLSQTENSDDKTDLFPFKQQ